MSAGRECGRRLRRNYRGGKSNSCSKRSPIRLTAASSSGPSTRSTALERNQRQNAVQFGFLPVAGLHPEVMVGKLLIDRIQNHAGRTTMNSRFVTDRENSLLHQHTPSIIVNIIDCCSQNTTYSAGKQTPCSIFFDFPLKISIGFCDRDASGSGYGFEFLLRKNYKTGFIIYQYYLLYRRNSAPARCRSGCKGEAPCPSETLCALLRPATGA